MRLMSTALPLLVVALAVAPGASAQPVTVIHEGKTIVVDRTLPDPTDLWVVPQDLTRINGFVLKPEGACLDEICIPIRQNQDNEMLVTRSGQQWFNVAAFARRLQQPFTVDHDRRIWRFGQIPLLASRKPR
jgi:hypothetical protein